MDWFVDEAYTGCAEELQVESMDVPRELYPPMVPPVFGMVPELEMFLKYNILMSGYELAPAPSPEEEHPSADRGRAAAASVCAMI